MIRPETAKKEVALSLLAANKRLKGVRLQLAIRGNRICIIGTLPPKPNSCRKIWHQQRISLGYRATIEGIKQAELEAREVSIAIMKGTFDWGKYIEIITPDNDPKISEVIKRFEATYFLQRGKNRKTQSTFAVEYLNVFKKLPQNEELSVANIMALIATTKPATRTRKRYCLALKQLAKFVGLEVDLSPYSKGYTPGRVEIRDLPSEDKIIELWRSIPNPMWRNAFAVIATYGIRPHEIKYLDFSRFPTLIILEGTKTNRRESLPIPNTWIDLFNISPTITLPNISGTTNRDIGERVCQAFRRYNIPFPPYNLRHAYAVRGSIQYRMPTPVMAKLMGHTASVHENTYLRHMKHEQILEIYNKTVASQTENSHK